MKSSDSSNCLNLSAPLAASVCWIFTVPRRRHTSSGEYGRFTPVHLSDSQLSWSCSGPSQLWFVNYQSPLLLGEACISSRRIIRVEDSQQSFSIRMYPSVEKMRAKSWNKVQDWKAFSQRLRGHVSGKKFYVQKVFENEPVGCM